MKKYRIYTPQENKYSLEVRTDIGGGGYQWISCEYLSEEEVDILYTLIDEDKNKRRTQVKRLQASISARFATIAFLQTDAVNNKILRKGLKEEVTALQSELTKLEEIT